jgi:hypothetical protein
MAETNITNGFKSHNAVTSFDFVNLNNTTPTIKSPIMIGTFRIKFRNKSEALNKETMRYVGNEDSIVKSQQEP